MTFFRRLFTSKINAENPIFTSGYSHPTQLDMGSAEGLRSWSKAMGLQTLRTNFF